jgi:citrate synthase
MLKMENAYLSLHSRPFNAPQKGLSYTENFLYMMDYLSEPNYRPNPKLARALDVLFILHVSGACYTVLRHNARMNRLMMH